MPKAKVNARAIYKPLAQLRARMAEGGSTEAKACERGLSKDVWESVSAFANTVGGVLLLGVDERQGFAVVDGFAADRVIDQLVEGMGDGSPQGAKLVNPPEYRISREVDDGHTFLAVEIDELSYEQKPCYIKSRGISSGSYRRVDAKDIRLSPAEIFEMQNALLPSPACREEVDGTSLASLDEALVDVFLGNVERNRSRAVAGVDGVAEKLERMNVVSASGSVRLAGFLSLGAYPQKEFPKLLIDVAVHPAVDKGGLLGLRFADRRECEGPIPEMVDEAMDVLARNLRTRSAVLGRVRSDELEIPEEVLREAVVNAILHREYAAQFRGQAVSVDVYPNRVEVANPGGLWGGKTIHNLTNGVSCCRNPELMKIMRYAQTKATLGTFAEGNGSGIPFMFASMRSRGLPDPVFAAGFDSVRVIFRREAADAGAVRAAGDMQEPQALPALREPGLTAGKPASQAALVPRVVRDDAVLNVLSASEPRSIRAISDAVGISVSALRPRLKRLVEAGEVIATAPPTSKKREYLLNSTAVIE